MAGEVVEKTEAELEAEQAAAELEAQKEHELALKDFTEGFTDEKVEPTEEEKAKLEEERVFAEKAEADRLAAEDAARIAAEPKFIKPTDQEFLDLVKKANSVDEIRQLAEKVRDTTNGRFGSLEQTIKKLQEATPVGQAITVSPEDFEEIKKDMPEHAKMLADGLTRVLSKFKGTGAPVASETPEQFEQRVNDAADKRFQAREEERLAREKKNLEAVQQEAREDLALVHPDWQTVIGPKDSSTEFRQYIKTVSPLYEKRILSTNDPLVLAEAITKFKEVQEDKKRVKPAAPNGRAERLREAVPPRGGAIPQSKNRTKTPEEEFAEGFKSE